ncbi:MULTISPECIES: CPBP family intramembrane glutamic endopeptidase [unclassified Roseovarius]|uniref:CPBP family intramembrane glutamic endopeptidase n=1 Tax=unclassified Roseovarius TaxID=2614913 RepID=UPI00273DD9E1|nr:MULTISPECIES: CPBP family intramembrane glutamic endopeptidase [unclassified Roseovarius]
MRYDAYDPLIAPARPTAGLQFLIAGIVLTILIYYSINYLVWMVIFAMLTSDQSMAVITTIDQSRTPGSVIINLSVFALLSVSLAISVRALHQRGLMSLIGPLPWAIMQFRRVLVGLVLLLAVTMFLPMPNEITPLPNLPFGKWVMFLPLTIIALLIQTSAEELAFRGYIQSQLAARFPNPVIWLMVPSVVFGLVHYDPSLPAQNALIVILWATLFGMAAADLTARSGTLGPAIALHFVNNFSAIAIAAPQGPFDGLALYTFPFSLASTDALTTWAPVDLLILLCCWLTARLALRR